MLPVPFSCGIDLHLQLYTCVLSVSLFAHHCVSKCISDIEKSFDKHIWKGKTIWTCYLSVAGGTLFSFLWSRQTTPRLLWGVIFLAFIDSYHGKLSREDASALTWGGFTGVTCCLSREGRGAGFTVEFGARNWVCAAPSSLCPFSGKWSCLQKTDISTLSLWVSHKDRSPHESPVVAQHCLWLARQTSQDSEFSTRNKLACR